MKYAWGRFLRRPAWGGAFPLALIGAFAVLAVQAVRVGLADVYEQAARLEIAGWGARPPGEHEAAAAATLATRSLRYAPNHPAALGDLGHLQLVQIHGARDPGLAVALARGANLNFRLSLAQRPTAALDWARLALSKLYLARPDEEVLSTLRLALKSGPRDPGVPELVAQIGMALWPQSDLELRREVVRALGVSASRDAKATFSIGRSYSRFDLMCDIKALRLLEEGACEQASRPD